MPNGYELVTCYTFIIIEVLFTNVGVVKHHNKMVWSNSNINNRLKPHVPYHFSLICLLPLLCFMCCLPLTVLSNVSPYEKLFGHAPNNTHQRAYGCLCYMSTLKQGRTKFDPRAEPCIFLGYPYAQKGYKVYNIRTKKTISLTR